MIVFVGLINHIQQKQKTKQLSDLRIFCFCTHFEKKVTRDQKRK